VTASSAGAAMAGHVVLLGDSVFDNGAYVRPGRDVIGHLKQQLRGEWKATLLAVDGSVMAGVRRQFDALPAGASHLVVSMGGNDALAVSSILRLGSQSIGESLLRIAEVKEQFCREYGSTLDLLLASGLPTAVCTIYDVRYPDTDQRRVAATALSILNDCITRAAAESGVAVIDLRIICNDDLDFANPIEPSEQGGGKIARAIVSFVTKPGNANRRSELIVA